jgi:polyisoprenoid-binding protein YceI
MVVFVAACQYSYADRIITFGPQETKINGSIKYSVIGRYKAQFGAFQGSITIDERSNNIRSVYLEIEASSIQSDCQWCDQIVRSDKLLAVKKYPKIIFKSTEIISSGENYTVKGTLDVHGVTKDMRFPFAVKIDAKEKTLDVEGQWMINRKDFKITWNKLLDQGGVLVGNYFTVDWGIKASI